MKYLSVVFLMVLGTLGIQAQKVNESSVPEVVKNNFTKVFPNTVVREWEITDGNYRAFYEQNDADNSALMSADGRFIQYEYSIPSNELPLEAREYITKNFAGQKMGGMFRLKSITGNVTYLVEVGNSKYRFDINGKYSGEEKTIEK